MYCRGTEGAYHGSCSHATRRGLERWTVKLFSCFSSGVAGRCRTEAVFTVGLLIIPTSQHSRNDLVRIGEEIETEKDELLEKVWLIG